jgi:hypothetical protein
MRTDSKSNLIRSYVILRKIIRIVVIDCDHRFVRMRSDYNCQNHDESAIRRKAIQ